MAGFARTLVVFGLGLAAFGAVPWVVSRAPGLGHLPGDLTLRRGNFTLQFALGSSILLSLALTLLLNLLWRR